MTRRLAPLLAAVAASVALIGLYVALGGGRYEPTAVADPCTTRDWRHPDGVEEALEQVVLSGLDGAACKLGVSREELVLALRNEDALDTFAAKHGISSDDAEDAIKEAMGRAVDDAEDAGVLPGFVASVVGGLLDRVPPHLMLELLDRLRGALT